MINKLRIFIHENDVYDNDLLCKLSTIVIVLAMSNNDNDKYHIIDDSNNCHNK